MFFFFSSRRRHTRFDCDWSSDVCSFRSLHMTMHSLTKSAIFFGVGYVSQLEGTQRIADIRGLTQSEPLLGWLLVIAVAAIAGLPPFGVFTSEFLLVTSTFARAPWPAALLGVGLM